MESPESRRFAVTLKHLAAQGGDSAQVTDAVVSTWKTIDTTLAPVIGIKGVAALYQRSLYLAIPGHPWLATLYTKDDTRMDLVRLKAALAQQDSLSAAAGGGAHLQTLYELLASLIGPSLTAQLLGAAWDKPFGRPASEDPSP
jgi:hypothetical protein